MNRDEEETPQHEVREADPDEEDDDQDDDQGQEAAEGEEQPREFGDEDCEPDDG